MILNDVFEGKPASIKQRSKMSSFTASYAPAISRKIDGTYLPVVKPSYTVNTNFVSASVVPTPWRNPYWLSGSKWDKSQYLARRC